MPEIFNTQTGLTEDVPLERVGTGFLSGQYRLPKGALVPMYDRANQPVSVPAEEVRSLLDRGGYQIAPETEVREALLAERYGGAVEGVKAFGEAALSSATLGLSDVVAQQSGLVTPEARVEREKQHPWLAGGGTIAGVIAPALLSGGASAAASVGKGALRTAAEMAPATLAVKVGRAAEALVPLAPAAAGAGRKVLQQVGRKALGSAVEGAVFGLGNVVKEAALGDPNLTAESALADIGLTAAISGGVGAALNIPSAFRGARALPQAIKEEAAALNTAKLAGQGRLGTLDAAVEAAGLDEKAAPGFLDALRKRKANAKDIEAAASRIGAPVVEGQVLANRHAQDAFSMLSQSPSVPGIAMQNRISEGFEKVRGALDDALASKPYTKEAAGEALRTILRKELDTEYAPLKELYEVSKASLGEIPVPGKGLRAATKRILDIEGVSLSPSSPQYQLAKSTADELGKLKTVDQLKAYKSLVGRRSANPELRYVAGEIRDVITDLEKQSIIRAAEQTGTPEIRELIDLVGVADKGYAQYRKRLAGLGSVLGKKKIYGPKDFHDFLDGLTAEKLADKLFTKGNAKFLRSFEKEFPEAMGVLRDYQKARIVEAATKDGQLVPARALAELKKLSPEVATATLGSQGVQKAADARTWLESLPANINPSGTSKSEAYRRFFTNPVSAVIENARDVALTAVFRGLAAQTGEDAALSTLLGIEKAKNGAVKRITDSATRIVSGVAGRAAPLTGTLAVRTRDLNRPAEEREKSERQELDRVLEMVRRSEEPEQLMEIVERMTAGVSGHAPQVSGGMQGSAIRALQFLRMKSPGRIRQRVLSPAFEPSPAERSKFNRYYRAVNNPLNVLNDMERGYLAPESLEALTAVYPRLYSQMQSSLGEAIAEHRGPIAYQRRLMMSMFMGEDLDDTTDAAAIGANQAAMSGETEESQLQSKAAGSPLTLASRIATPSQAAANRV